MYRACTSVHKSVKPNRKVVSSLQRQARTQCGQLVWSPRVLFASKPTSKGTRKPSTGARKSTKIKSIEISTPSGEKFYASDYNTVWWSILENQKKFVEYIEPVLGIQRLEDWYTKSNQDVIKHGGAKWLSLYKSSLPQALKAVYPTHHWRIFLFDKLRTPLRYWRNESNVREWLEWVAEHLGIKSLDGWYSVNASVLCQLRGEKILHLYSGSILQVLRKAYSDHNWEEWRFEAHIRNKWGDENTRRFIEDLMRKKGYSLEDLYKLTYDDWSNAGATGTLPKYGSSPYVMLKSVFSEHNWVPWLFNQTPARYFSDKSTHEAYIHWLGKELGYEKLEDWYNVDMKEFMARGGQTLLRQYPKNPIMSLLSKVYPDHKWLPWLFKHVPSKWWESMENRLQYLEWLKQKLNYTTLEDWYKVTYEDFMNNKGATLLKLYKSSPSEIVMNLIPNHEWLRWKFKNTRKGWWEVRENQLAFTEWFKHKLLFPDQPERKVSMYEGLEVFYNVTIDEFNAHGGRSLIKLYNDSFIKAITTLYDKHHWLPWKFRTVPRGFWGSHTNRRQYLEWLMKHEGWKSVEDMFSEMNAQVLISRGGSSLLEKYKGSISKMLRDTFPEYNSWPHPSASINTPKKMEKKLFKLAQRLYPQPYDVVKSVYSHDTRMFNSDRVLEFDAVVRSCGVVLELQGVHHFFDVITLGESSTHIARDVEKAVACARRNLSVIEVPQWWDGHPHSLVKTIERLRLFTDKITPPNLVGLTDTT